jgi:hypothetical protein
VTLPGLLSWCDRYQAQSLKISAVCLPGTAGYLLRAPAAKQKMYPCSRLPKNLINMKNYKLIFVFAFGTCCLLTSCSTSPEKYFDTAVLSCNMIATAVNGTLERELESPSVQLVAGTKDQTEQMKRVQVVNDRSQYIENNLKKVKGLKETADTKTMLQASIALHEYVLNALKTDYRQLATLYDQQAPKEQINSLLQVIQTKYGTKSGELYDTMLKEGQAYAKKHNINVTVVNPVPKGI